MVEKTVVYLPTEKRYAILVQVNTYYSVVSWEEDGQAYEIEIPNDEYVIVGTHDDG
jgi:hypothetical protein